MTLHPSYFELDLVAVGAGDPAVAEHAAGCAQCSAHLDQVREPGEVPAWVREVSAPAPARPSRWGRGIAFAAVLALAAGALIAPLVYVGIPDAPYVGAKGDPTVVTYLRRDGEVRPLRSGETVRAGDGLRLAVASPRHRFVAVRSGSELLFSGPIPEADDGLLPQSWRIDGVGDRETLTVIFTRRAFEPDHPERDAFQTVLSFAKEP